MAYTIYGAGVSPYVRKVRVLMAEKSIPYELAPVNPADPPEGFRQRSPLGKIPVLVDDRSGEEVAIPDSSVICSYLEQQHPETPFLPTDAVERARALWLEEFMDGGFTPVAGPGVFRAVVLRQMGGKEADVERANQTLEALSPYLDYLEGQLGNGEYLVGDRLTLADIAVASPFVNLSHAGARVPDGRWPKLAAFLGRLHARPSFAACIEGESPFFHRPVALSWG